MMLWAASMFELVGSTNNTQALRGSRGIDHSLHAPLHMDRSGLRRTTFTQAVGLKHEGERARDCTQYIAWSLSAIAVKQPVVNVETPRFWTETFHPGETIKGAELW
jgi:hypothetical protein